MARLSDVENALVYTIAQALEMGPNYVPGSTVSSPVVRGLARVYRGWPKSNVLNTDLTNGVTTVTVFPVAGSTRRTTRYLPQWYSATARAPTLTAAVTDLRDVYDPFSTDYSTAFGSPAPTKGSAVAIGGVVGTLGQAVGIFVGPAAYIYRVQASDTPASIAAALADMIASESPTAITDDRGAAITDDAGIILSGENVQVSGSTLTILTSRPVSARIACDQTSILETRRQDQNIWVTIWSPTPHDRDVAAGAVDDGLANLQDAWGRLTYDIPLADGSLCQIRYISNHTDDAPQQDNLWRRDLRYVVSYPTTLTQVAPTVISIGGTIDADVASFTWGTLPPA